MKNLSFLLTNDRYFIILSLPTGITPHRALRPGGKDGRYEEYRPGALNLNPSRLAGREKTATVREDSKEAMP